MNVHLVTVAGGCVDVLPHMLQHYRSQGIESIIINAHSSLRNDPVLNRIEQIAFDTGAEVASVTVAPWSQSINPLLYALARLRAPNDWFVIADQDELQTYPDGILDALKFCSRRGYDFIEGCFVDRIAADGRLAPVTPKHALSDQFPLGACISGPILGAVINKIVAAKGYVKLGPGQHHAYSGKQCPPSELYVPVHHFKWVDGLLDRLRQRVEAYKRLREAIWVESQKFLSYYESSGRIQIDDPDLLVARCDPEYPYWNQLRKWRLAASFFQGFPLRGLSG
jgi:hypothetical protein